MGIQIPTDFLITADQPQTITDAFWFIFIGNKLLVTMGNDGATVLRTGDPADLGITPIRTQVVGRLGDVLCMSAEIETVPERLTASNLRHLYGKLDDAHLAVAARAVQLVDWDRTHQFCGRCGTLMEKSLIEHTKVCPNCDHRCYPRLAPAVIVAVTDGRRILLGNNARYSTREMYSVLAGFVEPGETLEQTVAREIKEEVGINVTNIRYFGSQAWPFPHSLMVGFTADYAGGELVLQDEIRDAGWFTADNLPTYPPQPSIANDLITAFIANQN